MPGFGKYLFAPVLIASLTFGCLAHANTDKALEAYQSGKTSEAFRELTLPGQTPDWRGLDLLGTLYRDGAGTSRDRTMAYAYFLLSRMQAPDEQNQMDEQGKMVAVAAYLTPAEVRQAEETAVEWLLKKEGEAILQNRIKGFSKALSTCNSYDSVTSCTDIATSVMALGPAGRSLVPQLEALMTLDSKWIPRSYYAYGLAFIGTAGVPALARVLVDQKQIETEGTYNAEVVSEALSVMGPAAREALPALMSALENPYTNLTPASIMFEDAMRTLDEKSADMTDYERVIMRLKVKIVDAMDRIHVADPSIKPRLLDYQEGEKDIFYKVITAYLLASIYGDTERLVAIIPAALQSKEPHASYVTLMVTQNLLVAQPKLAESLRSIGDLILKTVGETKDPELRSWALKTLHVLFRAEEDEAYTLFRQGKLAESEVKASQLMADNPYNLHIHLLHADIHMKRGDPAKALEDYVHLLAADPIADMLQLAFQKAELLPANTGSRDRAAIKALLKKCLPDPACEAHFRSHLSETAGAPGAQP